MSFYTQDPAVIAAFKDYFKPKENCHGKLLRTGLQKETVTELYGTRSSDIDSDNENIRSDQEQT